MRGRMWSAGAVAGMWMMSVIWFSPKLAALGIGFGAATYWILPKVGRLLEDVLFSSFSSIATIWQKSVVSQHDAWKETQLPPILSTERCAVCAQPLVAGAQFCHRCGAAQQADTEEVFFSCTRCNASIPLSSHFCPMCRFPTTSLPSDPIEAFFGVPFAASPVRTSLHAHRLVALQGA